MNRKTVALVRKLKAMASLIGAEFVPDKRKTSDYEAAQRNRNATT